MPSVGILILNRHARTLLYPNTSSPFPCPRFVPLRLRKLHDRHPPSLAHYLQVSRFGSIGVEGELTYRSTTSRTMQPFRQDFAVRLPQGAAVFLPISQRLSLAPSPATQARNGWAEPRTTALFLRWTLE
jgi:hypothetical protein